MPGERRGPKKTFLGRYLIRKEGFALTFGIGSVCVLLLLAATGHVRDVETAIVSALAASAVAFIVLGVLRANLQLDHIFRTAREASVSAAAAQVTPYLYQKIAPPLPMPLLGGWVADPGLLYYLAEWIEANRPKLLVELGSGKATPILAHLMNKVGGSLISIEHDAEWADQTRNDLRHWRLTKVGEIHHVPLAAQAGAATPWYDVERLARLLPDGGIDILVVDGPPSRTGRSARYPALPALRKKLAPNSIVILDDHDRRQERDIMRRWRSENPEAEFLALTLGKEIGILSFGDEAASAAAPVRQSLA